MDASRIQDGTYDIDIRTDSHMVVVKSSTLSVSGESMSCTFALTGEGFSRYFEGTSQQAVSAPESDIVDYVVDGAGLYSFTVPVPALDQDVQVALFGQRRDRWYDHTLVFESGKIPANAVLPAGQDKGGAPGDGTYSVAVALSGGSGKATVNSPAQLTVADGKMTARIEWSSPNYDLMVVDGAKLGPVNSEGNSVFEVPIAALDADLPVQAETTAMSKPHLIDYTLRFDSSTLREG